MPNKLLLAALAVVVAHDVITQIETTRAAKAFIAAHEAHKQTEAVSTAQISYLLHVLVENGIEASEFDLIALNFHAL